MATASSSSKPSVLPQAVELAQKALREADGKPVLIVIMGTSGCGKSTVGAALGSALDLPFIDGDDLHPSANVEKMAHGVPLTDADRIPWLETIRERAASVASAELKAGAIVACSALRLSYRDILRGSSSASGDTLTTYHFYLCVPTEKLHRRMRSRKGHFMKEEMLRSQLATLEEPKPDEPRTFTLQEDSQTPSNASQREVKITDHPELHGAARAETNGARADWRIGDAKDPAGEALRSGSTQGATSTQAASTVQAQLHALSASLGQVRESLNETFSEIKAELGTNDISLPSTTPAANAVEAASSDEEEEEEEDEDRDE